MELKDFLEKFEQQLEDVEPGTITADTNFRELEEWDSMTSLVIIAMVDREFNKQVSGNDIIESTTVEDLFNIIKNK
ncbi:MULTISPECIES: acyl carrier protein [unclassified Chitinophaga]|uniref:acyl carrier protein n=1 Tax=unclassified Chitinophaga TaxID=2619133 RepID=UPI00300FEBBA